MIFEQIGVSQIDLDLACLKVQVGKKIYLLGLKDIEQALTNKIVIPVFQINNKPKAKEAAEER